MAGKLGGNLELLQRDHALGDELVRVLLQHVLLPADLLVHQRLGEHGLVHLVVAEASVAHLEADKVEPSTECRLIKRYQGFPQHFTAQAAA